MSTITKMFKYTLGEILRAAMLRSVERGYWSISTLDESQRASVLRFVQSADAQDLFDAARESGVSPITGMPYAPWIGWKGLDVTYAGAGGVREVASPTQKTAWKEYQWHQGDATQVWGHPLVPLFFLRSNVDPDKGFNDPDRNPYHGVHIAWSPLMAAEYSDDMYLVAPVDEVLVHDFGCLGLAAMTLHRDPFEGAKGAFIGAWHILESHFMGFEQASEAVERAIYIALKVILDLVERPEPEAFLEEIESSIRDALKNAMRVENKIVFNQAYKLERLIEDALDKLLTKAAVDVLMNDKPVNGSFIEAAYADRQSARRPLFSVLSAAIEHVERKRRQFQRFKALKEATKSLSEDDIIDLIQEGRIVIFGKAHEYYGDRAVYFMEPKSGEVGAIPFEEWRPVDAYKKLVREIPYVMFHPSFDGEIDRHLAYHPCAKNNEGLGVFNVGVIFDKYGVIVIDTREVDLGKFGQTEYVKDLFNWLNKYLAMARFGSINKEMTKITQRIQALLEYVEFCGGWEAIENVELLIRLAFVDFDFFTGRHKSMTLYEETVEVNGELRRVGVSFEEGDQWLSFTTSLTLYKQDVFYTCKVSKSYKTFNDLLRLYRQLSQPEQAFRYFFEQKCIEEDDDFQTETHQSRRQLVYESLAAVLVKLERI